MRKLLLAVFALLASSMVSFAEDVNTSIFNVTTPKRVGIHDPSIVVGYNLNGIITGEKSAGASKIYYIFGSHKGWARSNDLQNWTTFTNNLSTNFATIFAEDAKWAARGGAQGGSSYNVSGNLWAPDVVWNPTMKKWCMYMSVNGDNWYSSIVLLTADDLKGNWTRVGTVVYSGFTNTSEASATDFYKVHAGTDFPSRYNLKRNDNHTYGTNAIDPCAFFDEEGNMWMTYGSWFGGMYMLRLDKATGLRDYTYTYTTTDGTAEGAISDEYQGIKIAGGNHRSGEAPYIEYINDRYYLFVTYGALNAAGGYNMRVFSSTDVKGPYKDMYGHSAIWTSSNSQVGNTKENIGSRLMSYYKWNMMSNGYVAEGHNSTVVDDDGKAYVVYHTRFTNSDEYFEVRVHQLFTAENGGLVAAPFEYTGETLSAEPFSSEDIVGSYNVIYHQGTDYANLECQQEKMITLNTDGTISGAYTGTWSQSTGKPYVTIKIGTNTMQGVFIRQKMEGLNYTNLCFTVIGKNDIPMWGYKNVDNIIGDAIQNVTKLPISENSVVAEYTCGNEFNGALANKMITSETGISLSFYVTGLGSDWDEIGKSSDSNFTMYLSVLRYKGADFYEAAATVASESPVKTDLHKAFLNEGYYATISYNPDGTVSFYRNGTKLLTYAANLSPNYGSGTTPAQIVEAVINYYVNNQFDFSRSVYNIAVGYSVQYDKMATSIKSVSQEKEILTGDVMYNLAGQKVNPDYKGIVVVNGKKYIKK